MTTPKTIWITIERDDPGNPRVVCRRCGNAGDLPLDMPLGVPSEIVRAFLKVHQFCAATISAPVPMARRRDSSKLN